ncbi:methylated-DNA--[protein]-cysteine S-methyltransferase [Bacillus sp. JCM 19041]|uniref:methylated-DNA--[protein]-cysteine S-methyltransferase n=1 Tax=Bacillus sp. JCM 19041 TaxID=1460637 RepID=UPI000B28B400
MGRAYFFKCQFNRNGIGLTAYIKELDEYAQGSRQLFSFSFDRSGTPFQQAVWQALQDIPYGETVTYSAIAEKIDKPKAVRAVGTAIGANPILIAVPCHRVVSKSGRGSGYRGGLDMKQALLELEQWGEAFKLKSRES